MNKLNENIILQYNKWKEGYIRKENKGISYNTDFGEVRLKGEYDEDELNSDIREILSDRDLCDFDDIQNFKSCGKEAIERIKNDKDPYTYLIKNYKEGTCITFRPFDELTDYYYEEIAERYGELDYVSIIRLIVKYIRTNDIKIEWDKDDRKYKLLLYSGFVEDDDEEDDEDYGWKADDKIRYVFDEFGNEFDDDVSSWSYQYETNIGVDINSGNLKYYKEMRDWVEGILCKD